MSSFYVVFSTLDVVFSTLVGKYVKNYTLYLFEYVKLQVRELIPTFMIRRCAYTGKELHKVIIIDAPVLRVQGCSSGLCYTVACFFQGLLLSR